VVEEHTDMDPVEVTKRVAQMWASLEKEKKQPFLDAAHADKERFDIELRDFQRENPDEPKSLKRKKQRIDEKPLGELRSSSSTIAPSSSSSAVAVAVEALPEVAPILQIPSNSSFSSAPAPAVRLHLPPPPPNEYHPPPITFLGANRELPIFTDIFLEHNKSIESELKTLRKNNIDMEQQNSVLEKCIENMQNGVRKVEEEVAGVKQKNLQLEVYLTKLRCLLASGLHSLSLPGNKGAATVENIDKYMFELVSESTTPAIVNKARDIIRKMDLKIN